MKRIFRNIIQPDLPGWETAHYDWIGEDSLPWWRLADALRVAVSEPSTSAAEVAQKRLHT